MAVIYDFAVVGAGIAGASLAAGLAAQARVLLLEAEERPGYHSTGRSAAFWTESYGGPGVQPLTTASGPFLHEHGFLAARGALTLARHDELDRLEAFASEFTALGVRVERFDRAALERRLPGLRAEWAAGAYEPDCCDIDVAGLHQHWLAQARRGGAELWCRAALAGAVWLDGAWTLTLADGRAVRAAVLVNAAGAWADPVAHLAGIRPIGIQPYRRTVAQLCLAAPPPANLPLVLGIDETFYFKPEAGKLWLSPHDETPSDPCDAAPEELDVALAIDRFEAVVDWRITLADGRELCAAVLVNAAGAWADEVAERAGVPCIGIQPYRRTVAQLRLDPPPPADLPLVLGIDELFYFKPEAGKLWLSPHDETPSPPCDAAPEELDVALALDRFEHVVDWRIQRIEHKWAGLRSFAPDRLPVYGFDPAVDGFFWFAGQGGFGIQTAPAAAEVALRLLLGQAAGTVDPAPYTPARFR